ncbi:hypothetical protein D3C77_706860 [compost metagenome]
MRQLVAGVKPFEMRVTVDVVGAVHQPVGIEHDNGVDAHFAAAGTDFFVTINGGLTAAVMFTGQFRQIHRGNVRDLCG